MTLIEFIRIKQLSEIFGQHLLKIFLLSLLIGASALIPIWYMREIFGSVASTRSYDNLYSFSSLLIVLLTAVFFLERTRQNIISAQVDMFTSKCKLSAYKHIYSSSGTDKDIELATKSLKTVSDFLKGGVALALIELPVSLIMFWLLLVIHPTLFVFAVVGALLTIAIAIVVHQSTKDSLEKSLEQAIGARRLLQNIVQASVTAKIMGFVSAMEAQWRGFQTEFKSIRRKTQETSVAGGAASKTIMVMQGSVLLGVGTYLLIAGHLPADQQVYIIVGKFLGMLAVRPLVQIVGSWRQITEFKLALKSIAPFSSKISEEVKTSNPPPSGDLIVRQLSYRVAVGEGSTLILQDISFKVSPGDCLAIVGPPGSGKTSLIRNIAGIIAPSFGRVTLDGYPTLSADNSSGLHRYVSYCPAESVIMPGTVAENISGFGTRDGNVSSSLKIWGLTDEPTPPKGTTDEYDYGDSFFRLSGGMKRKFALARAFFGEPRLIILDEPTIHLDGNGLKVLYEEISNARAKGCIVVFASHFAPLLAHSSHILILNRGRQQAFGRTEALKQKITK